jgi:lysophospholipase L1-like esterase
VRRVLRFCGAIIKWMIVLVICVEALSFLTLTIINFIMWGHAREGSRAVYDAYTLFLQAHGIRDTTHNSQSGDRAEDVVIWCFGGSTMRGFTRIDAHTIPSQLVKRLNDNAGGLHFTAVNFGMNSFNSLLETKFFQKCLIERFDKPDVVIFYDGANDATYFVQYRNPYGHYGYRRTRALIESYYRSWFGLLKPLNAALYSSFTKELYDKVTEVSLPLEQESPELQELVASVEKRYDHVNKIAGCYGAQFILFWQPMLWMEHCEVPGHVKDQEKGLLINSQRMETARGNFSIPYRALAAKLKDKPYFVNLQSALCSRTEPVYRPDGVHLLDKGEAMVAERMAEVVKDRLAPGQRKDKP